MSFGSIYLFIYLRMFSYTILAKSYRNLKTTGFLDLFFFFKSLTKNVNHEYPNFDSGTSCKEKTTKNLKKFIIYLYLCSEKDYFVTVLGK